MAASVRAMPYDVFSIGVIVSTAALFYAASLSHVSTANRLALVLVAALLIRVDAASQRSLNPWDERYHALVAKNLIAHPLRPTLYREALLPYNYRDWMANHVWLHKPPGALWPMAASMSIFGVNEFAMRLPGVLLATLSVWLTFLIGAQLFGTRAGLLAAVFHAVNGFLVTLAAGRRVADHVDTSLIFWIEAGIWMALQHARGGDPLWRAGAGIALGAALLTKSLPGLLIVVVAMTIYAQRDSWPRAVQRAGVILAIGLAVAAPWTLYTRLAFPQEAAWTWQYMLSHIAHPIESHDRGVFAYVADAPAYFGELVWIPLIATAFAVVRGPHARIVIVWIAVTYAIFSAAQTRISGFVMIAAPAMFLLQANFWVWLRDRRSRVTSAVRRAALAVLLFGLLVLPARYLLDPSNVFERRDRSPQAFDQMRRIDAVLGLSSGVIFNIPMPIETMFYTRLLAYEEFPSEAQVRALQAQGIPIVIYVTETTPPLPIPWHAITLTADQLR